MIGFNGPLVSCDIASLEISRRSFDSGVRAQVIRQERYSSLVSFEVEGEGVRVRVIPRFNQPLRKAYQVAKSVGRNFNEGGFNAFNVRGASVSSVAALDDDRDGAKVLVVMFPDND